MIKCLIIDDEQIAQQIIEQYIMQSENLTLVGKCRNALEAFTQLEQQTVDLIFLDIEMPVINGLSFLKTLSNPPQVILTTAYAEFALQGYELNVVDYLLKPFSFERFAKAISKIKEPVIKPGNNSGEPDHLVIKEKGGLMKILYADIIYIEASKDYMKIVTAAKSFLVHLTMKSLEEALPADKFIRIHKSYIAGLQHIRIIKADSILVAKDQALPVSANYRDKLVSVFKK